MKNILKNKNVLITGATGGLGKEFCYQLADYGANLCITSKTESKLLSLQNKLSSKGVKCVAKSADFTLGIDNLGDCFDKIDILINCAGVYLEKSLDNLTDNDYEEIFDVNLKTPFKLIKEVSINMKNNRWGRIIILI